ncbi:MAG: DoxX family protein [Pseudonocardiales bacterium]|nr:MAG: DoxX family protein [Pseudonocardiales bacterium]
MKLNLLVTRTVVGGLFVGHGTHKLFGWFGGHGLEGTGGFFESIGVRPGRRSALVAGTAEALGGALLVAGLFTPIAAAALSSVMITAIRHVHGAKGPWVTDGGYEYNLVLLATMFALTEAGPGPVSLDHALGTERAGTPWAIGQLAAGAAGSTLVSRLAHSSVSGEGAPAVGAPSDDSVEAPAATPA